MTWSITDFATWTNVEVSLAIVSACLPSLRPIISYIRSSDELSQAIKSARSNGAHGFGAYARPMSRGLNDRQGGHIRLSDSAASRSKGSEAEEYPLAEDPMTRNIIESGV